MRRSHVQIMSRAPNYRFVAQSGEHRTVTAEVARSKLVGSAKLYVASVMVPRRAPTPLIFVRIEGDSAKLWLCSLKKARGFIHLSTR